MTSKMKKFLVMILVPVLVMCAGCMSGVPSDVERLEANADSVEATMLSENTDNTAAVQNEEVSDIFFEDAFSSDLAIVNARIYTISNHQNQEGAAVIGEGAHSGASVAMDYSAFSVTASEEQGEGSEVIGHGVQREALESENSSAPAMDAAIYHIDEDAAVCTEDGECARNTGLVAMDLPAPPING